MKISKPTNDQIVEIIAHNRYDGKATRIEYKGFEVWIYSSGDIDVDYPSGTIKVNTDCLIEIMTKNQAELVE